MNITETLAKELHLRIPQVENTVKLLDDGCTVPFIARYRKEMTGSLDDQVVRELSERLVYLRNLEGQREKVRAAITEQGAMTDEIAAALDAAATVTEIDDIYRPFRPKRKTRASVARERGLEPLAALLYAQARDCPDPLVAAAEYITEEVPDAEAALQGAMDIIAEMISDDAALRRRLRNILFANGFLVSKAAKEEDSVYRLYYDYRAAKPHCGASRFGDRPRRTGGVSQGLRFHATGQGAARHRLFAHQGGQSRNRNGAAGSRGCL